MTILMTGGDKPLGGWDDYDDHEEFCVGIDGCHHGLGWDEVCEDCEYEEWTAQRQAKLARLRAADPQLDLLCDEPTSNTSIEQSSEKP